MELIGRRPAPMDEDYSDAIARASVFVAVRSGAIAGLIVLRAEDDHLVIENVAVARLGYRETGRSAQSSFALVYLSKHLDAGDEPSATCPASRPAAGPPGARDRG